MGAYLIIIYLSSIFCLFNNFIKTNKNYFIKLSFIFLVLISYCRYEFGADYASYYKLYNEIILNQTERTLALEKGYILLNKLFIFFNLHFNFLIGTITLFNLFLIYKNIFYILEKKRYFYICIFTYLSLYSLFFYHLSMVRQSITISLFFYSTKYIYENSFKKYFLIILISSFFHKSAIILLVVYFIVKKIKMNYKQYIIFLSIAAISYVYKIKLINLLSWLLNELGMERYKHYVFRNGGEFFSLKNISILIFTFILIYMLKKSKNQKYILIIKILILNNFIYIFTLSTDILILNRVVDYFKIFYIFLPILIIENFKNLKIKNKVFNIIFVNMYIFMMTLFFIKTYINLKIEYADYPIEFLQYKNILLRNDSYKIGRE